MAGLLGNSALRVQIQLGLAVAGAGAASLFVAFWGDGIEVARHLLLPAVLTALGGLIMLCVQIDAVLDRLRARSRPGHDTQQAAPGL